MAALGSAAEKNSRPGQAAKKFLPRPPQNSEERTSKGKQAAARPAARRRGAKPLFFRAKRPKKQVTTFLRSDILNCSKLDGGLQAPVRPPPHL